MTGWTLSELRRANIEIVIELICTSGGTVYMDLVHDGVRWVSGTASISDSIQLHFESVLKQESRTIDAYVWHCKRRTWECFAYVTQLHPGHSELVGSRGGGGACMVLHNRVSSA